MSADIGLVGLAVMGENLVLNMESHGYTVAVYNRTVAKVDEFVTEGRGKGKKFIPAHSIEELAKSLKRPRRVIILVRAGSPVDHIIDELVPHWEAGDIIIDGGNSLYTDTNRRYRSLKEKGILFVGSGVSGGEEGALKGPSLMPGGAPEAWEHIKPVLQSIAAKANDGTPCCDWVGEEGAGHFVKMVHNGIEYGDMQLICETYHLLKQVLGLSNAEIAAVFEEYNKGDLDSYLIEITAQIFAKKDEEGDGELVDKILDVAGQKGTGKWTATAALDFGIPVTLIGEAVFARCLSSLKDERVEASKILRGPESSAPADRKQFVENLARALYAAKLVSYAQGFLLFRTAAKEYGWHLNFGSIAAMWRGGCIIRSQFLNKITEAYTRNPDLSNLLLDPYFTDKIHEAQKGWRAVVAEATLRGIPVPAFSTALSYFDGFRSEWLPANLLQAQRDYFGAHTYERVDQPRGKVFHTNWTGHGGSTSASSYNV